MPADTELCFTPARKLVRMIRARKLSATELTQAFIAQIARAESLRTELFHRMRRFLERYDFLLCPVSQLPPYPVTVEWPRAIAGVSMENYLDWMKSCYYITITSHPAISVPAGFTRDEPALPVGLQIVGRYRDDLGVLQLAHAFEQATRFWQRRPAVAA